MDDPTWRDARRRTPPEPAAAERQRSGQGYALVVGINDYGRRHPSLQNAVNDAEVVGRRLEDDFGFAVTSLFDEQATAGAIRGCLDRWQAEAQPEDQLLFFFAGHGDSRRPEGGDSEGYLLPADAGRDPASWLPEAEVIERVQAMAARRLFLVLDACYTGAALRVSDALRPGARQDQVLKILVAGTENQPVLDAGAGDHSIFTRAVLEGLDGLADVGKQPDGVVTAGELITYVISEVPWRSRLRAKDESIEQTPKGGTLQGTPEANDFEFRPSRPRLPAALLRNVYSPQVEDRIAAAEQLKARHDTRTSALAAEELLHLVRNDRDQPGDPMLAGEDLLSVQRAALEALGELGHPAGLPLLVDLVSADGQDPRLRETAAPALGRLLQLSAGAAGDAGASDGAAGGVKGRQKAFDALISALGDPHPDVREAAKRGLGHVPAASPRLQDALDGDVVPGRQVADALACIAIAHPDHAQAWPSLALAPSLWRRYHLLRRRLAEPLRELMVHAVIVGLAGMLGLCLAFLPVQWVAEQGIARRIYMFATLAMCAAPGFAAGVAYAVLPPLSRAASRPRASHRPGSNQSDGKGQEQSDGGNRGGGRRAPTLAGVLLAGLAFGPFLAIPNWFLGIGCHGGGCPSYAWALFLLPGLVAGPLIGLALGLLLRQPRGVAIQPPHETEGARGRQVPALLAVGLVSGLALALVRIPPAVAVGSIDPAWVEPVLWGLGGFLFGLLLAAAWSLPLSPAEGAAPAVGRAWTFLAGGARSGGNEGGNTR